jgi:tetraacyldisaccharide 4'-kinase
LARLGPGRPIVLARHRPAALLGMDGAVGELADAMPRRVVCFAGIANPSAFAASLAGLGVDVAARRFWPDHHAYRRQDVDALGRLCREHQAQALLTTCKDLVKLRALPVDWAAPIWALRVTIDLAAPGDTILADLLSRALGDAGCTGASSPGSAGR